MRPIMSPSRPNTNAPNGLTKKPAAKAIRAKMNAVVSLTPAKNCLLSTVAKAPYKKKSYHSKTVPRDDAKMIFRSSRPVVPLAGAACCAIASDIFNVLGPEGHSDYCCCPLPVSGDCVRDHDRLQATGNAAVRLTPAICCGVSSEACTINCAAFSPIIRVGEQVLPDTMLGMIEASATLKPGTP